MNKVELIDAISVKAGLSKKDSGAALEATISTIVETLSKGEQLQMAGLGAFIVKDTAAKKGINPATKESIDIPAGKRVSFKPAKALKDSIK